MPLLRHDVEVLYLRRLYAFIWRYHEEPTADEGLDWLSLCCSKLLYSTFYRVRDAADWWRTLDFERVQCINVRVQRFVERHNLEMFASPPRE